MRNRDRMNKAINEARKKNGEPPAPPLTPAMPINKRVAKLPADEARDSGMEKRGRLPAGSCFSNLNWNGQRWCGRLVVPQCKYDGDTSVKRFDHEADGVFRLLSELDSMYRKWKAEQK